jgi:hypothetical protein
VALGITRAVRCAEYDMKIAPQSLEELTTRKM